MDLELPIASRAEHGERDHQCLWSGAEGLEPEPLVERDGILVNCVHDQCTNGDLLRCTNHAPESVVEQRRADSLALMADIDSKASKDRDRDREVSG